MSEGLWLRGGRFRLASAVVRSKIALLLLALEPTLGCAKVCEDVDPSFQLDIRSGTGVGSVEVTIDLDGSRYERTFDLDGKLDDGMTSLVVTLEPEQASFEAQVEVVGYSGQSGQGGVIAEGEQTYAGTPDGCNHFEIELSPVVVVPDECEQSCAIQDCSASCSAACPSCSFSCAATRSCMSSCTDRSTCDVRCDSVGDCTTDCDGSSTCDIECNGSASCSVSCRRGSSCRLRCGGSGACNFTCNGNQSSCPDGTIVCNRDCP